MDSSIEPAPGNRRRLLGQIFLIFALSLLSFFATSFFFLKDTALYWDTAQHFVQFRDNLHSLNQFGQVAWWFPQNQFGWPNYYYSILGFPHGASPLFALIGFCCWLLGRFGFVISSYHAIYVVYFGFLAPLLFTLSVNFFIRHFLKSQAAITFALILAAFSPGVVANISDIGFLEPATYSLFFASAFLSFFRRQSRLSFACLCFTSVTLGISCNYSFLFWNLIAIPLFVAVFFILAGRRRRDLWRAMAKIKIWQWALCIALFGVGLLPNLFAYRATTDLVKPNLGGQSYTFRELKPGNPIAVFTASLPAFGFEWAPGYRDNWTLLPRDTPGVHLAYYYMGLLCVPLLVFGLVFGRGIVRTQLIVILVLSFGIVNLSGYSPLFAWLLALPTPLRAVNHYSDLFYRSGAFIILMVGAAFGLDTALERKFIHKSILLKIYGVLTILSLLVFAVGYKEKTAQSASFGFALFVGAVIAISLARVIVTHRPRELTTTIRVLLLVTLVDVSTQTFIHLRRVMLPNDQAYRHIEEKPAPNGIGLVISSDPYYFVNSVLVHRRLTDMQNAGIDIQQMDTFKLFFTAHVNTNVAAEANALSHGFGNYHSLVMEPADSENPAFKPFFRRDATPAVPGDVKVVSRTYNNLDLEVHTKSPALLFIKDSYSRFWKGRVNGQPSPIGRALYNFKAVAVPAGTSKVSLRFFPPAVGFGLAAAYAAFVATAGFCAFLWWRSRRDSSQIVASNPPLPHGTHGRNGCGRAARFSSEVATVGKDA